MSKSNIAYMNTALKLTQAVPPLFFKLMLAVAPFIFCTTEHNSGYLLYKYPCEFTLANTEGISQSSLSVPSVGMYSEFPTSGNYLRN